MDIMAHTRLGVDFTLARANELSEGEKGLQQEAAGGQSWNS